MRYEFIQFARGYAIFTIMLFHFMQRLPLPALAQKGIIFGGTGVHLFFLLSGFGLALSKNQTTPLAFYRRRLSKVWLPYFIALTLSLIAGLAFSIFPDRWEAWCAGWTGYQMFSHQYIEAFGGHFWFISTILQFYLVFPLLQNLQNHLSSPIRFFTVCLIASVCWWLVVFGLGKGDLRNWNSFFLQFLWEFGAGMALAQLLSGAKSLPPYLQKWVNWWTPERWVIWLLTGLGGLAVMITMILRAGALGPLFNDIPALIGYGCICVSFYLFSTKYLPMVVKAFKWIGDYSFAIYLTHILALEFILLTLQQFGYSLHIAIVPAFLATAFGFGWLFENIIMKKLPHF